MRPYNSNESDRPWWVRLSHAGYKRVNVYAPKTHLSWLLCRDDDYHRISFSIIVISVMWHKKGRGRRRIRLFSPFSLSYDDVDSDESTFCVMTKNICFFFFSLDSASVYLAESKKKSTSVSLSFCKSQLTTTADVECGQHAHRISSKFDHNHKRERERERERDVRSLWEVSV